MLRRRHDDFVPRIEKWNSAAADRADLFEELAPGMPQEIFDAGAACGRVARRPAPFEGLVGAAPNEARFNQARGARAGSYRALARVLGRGPVATAGIEPELLPQPSGGNFP